MQDERDPSDREDELARPENFDAADTVSCAECEKEVPRSEAKSVEGRDYVWYFCGLDCYAHWKRPRGGRG